MTASGIASRIIGFFYRIFLAQTIGAEALGIYQLIAPVFAMCFALTASSIQTSISKFVGDACGKNAGTSQGEITARGYLLLGLLHSLCNRRYFSLHTGRLDRPAFSRRAPLRSPPFAP